jgi:hypothetical protein
MFGMMGGMGMGGMGMGMGMGGMGMGMGMMGMGGMGMGMGMGGESSEPKPDPGFRKEMIKLAMNYVQHPTVRDRENVFLRASIPLTWRILSAFPPA